MYINYLRIQNPTESKPKELKLYDFQVDLVQTLVDNKFVYINNRRQVGTTTALLAYCYETMMVKPGINIIFQLHSRNASLNTIKRFKEMLPDESRSKLKSSSKNTIKFENYSSISCDGAYCDIYIIEQTRDIIYDNCRNTLNANADQIIISDCIKSNQSPAKIFVEATRIDYKSLPSDRHKSFEQARDYRTKEEYDCDYLNN